MTKLAVLEGKPFAVNAEDRVFLLERLGGFVEAHHGGISVRRLVGHLRLPSGITLSITSSKAPAASVLAWVAYVDPTLRVVDWTDDVVESGARGDIASWTTYLFLRELRQAAARSGVPRIYQPVATTSATVRGRIEFGRLLQRGGDLSKLPCTVWERRPVSPTMRTIAAALAVVQSDPVMRESSPGDLRALRTLFHEVPAIADPEAVSGKTIVQRNESGFARSLALARMILRAAWLGEEGLGSGTGFLINLEALFEQTVVRALEENGVSVRPKHPMIYTRFNSAKEADVAGMQMDAFCPTLATGGVVIDAKYKTHISAGNLQQMVTYCFATGSSLAVLVVPAGHIKDRSPYRFRDGGHLRREVVVHVVELDTAGEGLLAWRSAGEDMVTRLSKCLGVETRTTRSDRPLALDASST